MRRKLQERFRSTFIEEIWNIGYVDQTLEELVAARKLKTINWLHQYSSGKCIADPFCLPGTNVIFCEELMLSTKRGAIAALEVERSHIVNVTYPFMDNNHHSYPMLFFNNGKAYMLPEDIRRGCTTIYEIDSGNYATPLTRVLPGRRLADATLVEHGGRFWLFATDIDIGYNNNLCLFSSDALTGPFVEHPQSPIKHGLSGSRCGGAFFKVGTRMFRPAQNCERWYGASLAIFEIIELTEHTYSEQFYLEVVPRGESQYKHGLHTLSYDGHRIWVDGKYHRISFRQGAKQMFETLSRMTNADPVVDTR